MNACAAVSAAMRLQKSPVCMPTAEKPGTWVEKIYQGLLKPRHSLHLEATTGDRQPPMLAVEHQPQALPSHPDSAEFVSIRECVLRAVIPVPTLSLPNPAPNCINLQTSALDGDTTSSQAQDRGADGPQPAASACTDADRGHGQGAAAPRKDTLAAQNGDDIDCQCRTWLAELCSASMRMQARRKWHMS